MHSYAITIFIGDIFGIACSKKFSYYIYLREAAKTAEVYRPGSPW